MYNGHWFGGGFMWVLWIFLMFIIIWLGKTFLESNNEQIKNKQGKTALDILNERYAKGEIEQEEFEQKKSDLGYSMDKSDE